MAPTPHIILASTSPYRKELLSRFRLPFDVQSPLVDETPHPGENPMALALRLAVAKAHAVARLHPDAIVIGSDQVADLNGVPMGKPGHHARAVLQLQAMSGQMVQFHTAVAVVAPSRQLEQARMVTVHVKVRELQASEIEHYLQIEEPYDCAGSAKAEGLGITLLSSIESTDPTALIGLPLIATSELLRAAGVDLLPAPEVQP
ncbi:MAG: septum formation inhibitor Maf [Burkholderiaceae bacterium]|nr:MAG: septum formation inhibitor Maf [Burkholderiaceae bacterium]